MKTKTAAEQEYEQSARELFRDKDAPVSEAPAAATVNDAEDEYMQEWKRGIGDTE